MGGGGGQLYSTKSSPLRYQSPKPLQQKTCIQVTKHIYISSLNEAKYLKVRHSLVTQPIPGVATSHTLRRNFFTSLSQTPPSKIMLIFDFGCVDKQLHIPNCRKQRHSVLINVNSVIVGVIYERNTLKKIISQTD